MLPENFVPSIKTLPECLDMWVILCSNIVDFKSSVFGSDLAMGLMV